MGTPVKPTMGLKSQVTHIGLAEAAHGPAERADIPTATAATAFAAAGHRVKPDVFHRLRPQIFPLVGLRSSKIDLGFNISLLAAPLRVGKFLRRVPPPPRI